MRVSAASALLLVRRNGVDVGDDQRARAFVREHFAENALGRVVRHDVHAAHAAANRLFDRLRLRQHAVDDALLVLQALEARAGPCRR